MDAIFVSDYRFLSVCKFCYVLCCFLLFWRVGLLALLVAGVFVLRGTKGRGRGGEEGEEEGVADPVVAQNLDHQLNVSHLLRGVPHVRQFAAKHAARAA